MNGATLVGSYDLGLVGLSYGIAVAAAFAALDLTGRIAASRGKAATLWLVAGALVMGQGIWAMHFVGMLAFELPVVMRYDLWVVALSVVPAVLASGLALRIASGSTLDRTALVRGSLFMGAAICGMHYAGMAAVRTQARLSYIPWIVLLSIVIAVVASGVALKVAFWLRQAETVRGVGLRALSALVLGAAVGGMHYTAMAAAVFTPTASVGPPVGVAAGSGLAVGVPLAALLATGVALSASFLDRRGVRRQVFKLTVIMTTVTAAVGVVCLTSLYWAAHRTERERLRELAAGQARLIEEMTRPDEELVDADASDPISRVRSAHELLGGFGRSGTYLLGQRTSDGIVLLGQQATAVPAQDEWGVEAMRRALDGESGTLVHPDPRGVDVLAAYEPVRSLDLGIVAQIDVDEVRAPFLRTALIAVGLATALIFLGAFAFARIGNPLIERLEQGDFLDSVISSVPSPLVIKGPDRRVLRVNAAFEQVFGKTSAEVEGGRLEDCFEGGPSADLSRLAGESIDHTTSTVVDGLTRADGAPIPLRIWGGPVGGLGNGAAVFVMEDLTESRRSQEALRRVAELERHANEAKSAFLANMSHEIRTPMNGVMGMLELLLDTELEPDQRQSADMAMGSARALLTLLNDVLDFSKIEAGHLELEDIQFDIQKLLSDTTRVFGPQAIKKNTELGLDIEEGVPTVVSGDPGRLRQVLTNLLGNAIKFTDAGDVRVSARRVGAPGDGAGLEISVSDTGIGIAKEKLETIFEEFSQADVSVTRTHGGTGLGLAISRKLVELMGGELTVRSEEGEGSTFGFVIPLRPASRDTPPPPHRPVVKLENRRILVVDDNEMARRIARGVIEGAGGLVDEAEGAEEGLALLREADADGDPYDAAIIDSMMPVRDGFWLAEQVRDDPGLSGTRLLMLTSLGEQGGRQRAQDYGLKGYLAKPVPRADLLRAAQELLGMRGPGEGEERRIITHESLRHSNPPRRILLAEDNHVNQHIAVSMLEKWGHEVDVAETGQEVLDMVQSATYDIVLMDVQMPVMDGLTATRAIRTHDRFADLPIIALTAHALSEERSRCEEAGMNGFVTKPYRADELSAAIREHTG